MWTDWPKEKLEQLVAVINNVFEQPYTETMTPSHILDGIKTDNSDIVKEIEVFVSSLFNTPIFLLEMADAKSAQDVIVRLADWRRQILDHIELQVHPDNLPELLYGQREFGCVYLPTKMLKHLYSLGEAVSYFLSTKDDKHASTAEKQMLEIMLQSADWVKYTKRKWGKMPNTDLAVVSPLNEEDIKTATPEPDIEPIPF
jgi:hypothetical protein